MRVSSIFSFSIMTQKMLLFELEVFQTQKKIGYTPSHKTRSHSVPKFLSKGFELCSDEVDV